MMEYQIYSLVCPLKNEVMYVGKTKQPLEVRLIGHIYDKNNKDKAKWIKSLRARNIKPQINLLEVCSELKSNIAEKNWIKYFNKIGVKLFNINSCNEDKIQTSWQLEPDTIKKVKAIAKKDKVAVQVAAELLIIKGLEK